MYCRVHPPHWLISTQITTPAATLTAPATQTRAPLQHARARSRPAASPQPHGLIACLPHTPIITRSVTAVKTPQASMFWVAATSKMTATLTSAVAATPSFHFVEGASPRVSSAPTPQRPALPSNTTTYAAAHQPGGASAKRWCSTPAAP